MGRRLTTTTTTTKKKMKIRGNKNKVDSCTVKEGGRKGEGHD